MAPSSESTGQALQVATDAVELALKGVHDANQNYIVACKMLARAKYEYARAHPHEWLGMQVYRIMGGGTMKTRAEHGTVRFKEYGEDDFGNPHIAPGSYYVLVGETSTKPTAHLLNKDWQLDLL